MTGLIVVLAILLVATAFGIYRMRTDGRVKAVRVQDEGVRLTAADIGSPLGDEATLVEFSSAFCAPCKQARRVLSEVAEMVPGVVFTEIDAEAHLDLVRELGIGRTPTTLILDENGREIHRAVGAPTKPDVIAALGKFVSPQT